METKLEYNKELSSFFADKRFVEGIKFGKAKYPIIWRKESCLLGECSGDRTEHWWSVPLSSPGGLAVECFHCHKTKIIQTK